MVSTFQLPVFAAAFGLLVVPAVAQGRTPTVEELQEQNRNLQHALAEANKAEKQASEGLAQIRERLEALGKNLLDGGNDRLIQAAADLQLANERNAKLESSVSRLVSSISDYRRNAVVSDPNALLRLETSLRELDEVLGLGQKPRPEVRTGSLQQANVVSIDQDSGMLVLNLSENQGAKIGMTFSLRRGQQPFGKAIITDVRKGVSGAFVERLDVANETPRPGDLAILETE